MADCEAPSFSLGLDFDQPVHESTPHSPLTPPGASPRAVDDEEGLGPRVVESDPDVGPDPPPRILKRLRRGSGNGSSSSVQRQEKLQSCLDGDDDIEEFSSQDDLLEVHAHPSKRHQPLCSSSRVSFSGSGVLASHSSSNWKERKIEQTSDIPASARLEMGQRGLVFPKLTTSPLRRFQLLDSDSDDPESVNVSRANKIDPFSKEPTSKPSESLTSFEQIKKPSFQMHQNQDLWKDFSPVKSYSIPTPALNEVCEEYFRSKKANEVEASVSANHKESFFGTTSCQKDEQIWDSTCPLPTAHRYFFHEDPRIQKLVRSRLSNFSLLGVNKVNQQPNASDINYMGQFSNGEASKKKGIQKGYPEKSSTRGRNKSKNLTIEEAFEASGGWVDPKINSSSKGESSKRKATKKNNTKNTMSKGRSKSNIPNSSEDLYASGDWVEPKSCANMPKDAGKRRVQASDKSAGHWYTGSDGRKVYVTKGGQELTGQAAYKHYRKESGSAFTKSKKKTSAKKKRN